LRAIVLGALLICCAAFSVAQEAPRSGDDPLYPFWEEVAGAAEESIDDAEDSTTDDLEVLRSRLATFRNEFGNERNANADRIGNLRSQIAALGPVPETGIEPPEVTAKRAELEAELDAFLGPVRVADAAFERADGLIGEIDGIIRERTANRLLSLGPSPLDPRNWAAGLADMGRILQDLRTTVDDLSVEARTQRLQDQLPLVVLLTLIALTLIVNGRKWAGNAIEYMRAFGGRGSGVWSFLVSLLRIILPLIGVYILAYAIRKTGLLSAKVEDILTLLPIWAGMILMFRWLAERLFSRNEDDALLPLSKEKRTAARFYMLLLSLLFVTRGFLAVVFQIEGTLAETVAIVAFPVVVLMALVLFLMGVLLRTYKLDGAGETPDDLQHTGLPRVIRFVGNFMIGVSLAAPVMAGIGYAEAGNALLYPTVLSLVLFGLVLVLQRFFADVYGLVTNQGIEARDGLAAILMGFLLVLAALPLAALIWGARMADLTELWTQFLEGFEIGGTRISPSNFMVFAIVFVLGYTVTRLLQSTLRQNVLPKTRIDIGGQNALVSGLGYVGIFLSAIVAVTVAGLDLSGFALVAGALSVGIGFGLQTIVSNFVSGIILLVERPISEGDWIEVGGQMGYVKDISVRSTRIETFDRTDVIVPNSDLISGTVTNYTRGNTIGRLIVSVGVAYGTDTKKVDRILREIAEAQPMVMAKPPPTIIFSGFGADSLDFEIRAILRDVNWMLSVKNDINHEIAARFAEEGIEIPFAQRDIWLRNPEALHGPPKEAT
ncbi:MAG: DUF3772 domain-containing protein, partial [Roseobacter sp.]|nr:DUF3772 domain-containing protein [Roseobacter sp.]